MHVCLPHTVKTHRDEEKKTSLGAGNPFLYDTPSHSVPRAGHVRYIGFYTQFRRKAEGLLTHFRESKKGVRVTISHPISPTWNQDRADCAIHPPPFHGSPFQGEGIEPSPGSAMLSFQPYGWGGSSEERCYLPFWTYKMAT